MKKAGSHDNWTSLRRILGNLQRTTTTFRRSDSKTLHVRKTTTADAENGESDRLFVANIKGGLTSLCTLNQLWYGSSEFQDENHIHDMK